MVYKRIVGFMSAVIIYKARWYLYFFSIVTGTTAYYPTLVNQTYWSS